MKCFTVILCLFCVCVSCEPTTCGVTATNAPIHRHPWVVVLEYYYRRQLGNIRCAGTLISRRHIITSAHCVELGFNPIIMIPRLGEYDVTSDPDCVGDVCSDPVVRMVVERVVIHPGYRSGRANDLAILVLEADAPYTDFIRPICLPTGSLDQSTVFQASGFGETPNNEHYSDIKKDIPLPYYHQNCTEIYKKLSKDLFCAGGIANFDTCNGDSGGPLVRMKERAELWGVTKGGKRKCGIEGKPGVYTSVVYHLDWINRVMELNVSGTTVVPGTTMVKGTTMVPGTNMVQGTTVVPGTTMVPGMVNDAENSSRRFGACDFLLLLLMVLEVVTLRCYYCLAM